jgi:YD repeat-containing protein
VPPGATPNYQNGQRRTATDPDAGTTTYTYDKNGNLTSTVDGRNVKLSNVYDRLSRKTEQWRGDPGTGTKLAARIYDSYDKGHLAGTARYVNGKTYYLTYPQRDGLYRPLKTSYIVPSDAGAELAKTYDFSTSYNIDNTVQGIGLPAGGGLAAESLAMGYDSLQRPVTLTGATSYVTDTQYAATGEILQNTLYAGSGKKAWQTFAYERGTGRLIGNRIDRQSASIVDMDAVYRYDDAGNVLSIADTPAGSGRDIQCFTYDYLRRLTEAWSTASTATDPCAGGDVTASGVGGTAPYHEKWTFRPSGDRDTETIYNPATGAPTTRTYRYPPAGSAQPHTFAGRGPDHRWGHDAVHV